MTADRPALPVVRRVDETLAASTSPGERLVQRLIERETGTGSCTMSWVRTPVGGGSPEGFHIHRVDQIFYVVAGRMEVEIGDRRDTAGPGSVVLFPAGVPHRNWNGGDEPTIHLAISVPAPDPAVPFAEPAPGGAAPGGAA